MFVGFYVNTLSKNYYFNMLFLSISLDHSPDGVLLHSWMKSSGPCFIFMHNYAFDDYLGQIRSHYVEGHLQAVGELFTCLRSP